ncbi:DUF982 domain-containing protein [Nordella sp. HKS 07]|uniref:DUF982 domain-containing protein n=1 Tax=Nordella sp. HKS 07 TaxID=2712222 RepID=UPI0013E10948|nr:DUF982 domain-containing protein [Nordella sp. HKS 07]QIG50573.1 DUF982 domain-containing protein [Nordella sp. HKS 07]
MDWAKPGMVRQVNNLEMAAAELLKWPRSAKGDGTARLVTEAHAGKAEPEAAKKAFEAAAREARVWLPQCLTGLPNLLAVLLTWLRLLLRLLLIALLPQPRSAFT